MSLASLCTDWRVAVTRADPARENSGEGRRLYSISANWGYGVRGSSPKNYATSASQYVVIGDGKRAYANQLKLDYFK